MDTAAKIKTEAESKTSQLMKELLKKLSLTIEHIGYIKPLKKVYELTNPLKFLPQFFTVLSLAVKPTPQLTTAILTIFRQFHSD